MQEVPARQLEDAPWQYWQFAHEGIDRTATYYQIKRIVDVTIVLLSALLLLPQRQKRAAHRQARHPKTRQPG